MSQLDQTLTYDPGFKEALERGEPWAVKYAEMSDVNEGLLPPSGRKHPERTFDGTRRNWCGHCSSSCGCVVCELDDIPGIIPKEWIGKDTD